MTGKKYDIWQSSENSSELRKKNKIYQEKLTLSDETAITDSYGLSNNLKSNVSLLPELSSWADIYN